MNDITCSIGSCEKEAVVAFIIVISSSTGIGLYLPKYYIRHKFGCKNHSSYEDDIIHKTISIEEYVISEIQNS